MKKKFLSTILALAMVLSLLPVTAGAEGVTNCQGGDTCTHEAAITKDGTTTHYDTLKEALNAATDGQTVTLLKNIDNSVDKEGYDKGINYTLQAGTTLDGKGHTLSGHIGVHIPAAGATVKNVNFINIHNTTEVDEDTCEYYGWKSKIGNQSAIYASKLTGTATITGCTFDNIDWDAIQITPAATTAGIVIKNNVFQHTATDSTQLRYVHVEHNLAIFSGNKINELTITDNLFYDTENPGSSICSIGVWYINRNTITLKVDGNYIETPTTAEVDKLTVKALYPMRSDPEKDVDDIAPVAYYGSEVYFSLQEAIDKTKTYLYLMADVTEDANIPVDRKITFYPYGYDIGTLTNNGELTIYGSDLAGSSQIVNNGTMSLSGNSATVYDIENNGTIKITRGATYNLSKITGSGTVTITGGTFSTKPSDTQLAQWYKAVEQSGEPVTYKVSSMTMAEKVEAGVVATSSSSSGNCYTRVTEGVNATDKDTTYLQTDSDEDVVIRTPYSGGRSLYANKHSFTGSIVIQDNCDFLNLLGSSFNLKYVSGDRLRIGFYSTAADVTIQDADLDLLEVSASGDCTVTGGNYDSVIAHTYYDKTTATTPKYTAELSITGGCFASDTVTRQYTDIRPEGVPASEKVSLSEFLPVDYTVVKAGENYLVLHNSALEDGFESGAAVVAEVNGKYYTDLSNAISAAVDGDTVTLLGKYEGEAVTTISKAITIDLGDTGTSENQFNADTGYVKSVVNGTKLVFERSFTITFVYCDGTTGDTTAVTGAGGKLADLPTPSRSGYTFNGWYTEQSGGTAVTNDTVFTQNTTIYAQWTQNAPSGGGSGSGSSGGSTTPDKVETVTNPDGSTTTTVTKPNGTVTETTKNPDGSKESVETKPDGTVTTTTTDAEGNQTEKVEAADGTVTTTNTDTEGNQTQVVEVADGTVTTTATDAEGNKTETVSNPDGSGSTTMEQADGSTSATTVDETGKTQTQVTLPQQVIDDAAQNDQAVALPMPRVAVTSDKAGASTVTVELPEDTTAKVEIPVENVTAGTVAVLVKEDGTEEVIKSTLTTENGVAVTLSGGETVKIVDNTKTFEDVPADHWAADTVAFASSRELFNGTSETTFAPAEDTTRAMVVTVLARYEGVDTDTGDTWFEAGADWAVENGVSDGTNLDQTITREQLVTMLWRYAGKPILSTSMSQYPDYQEISLWAADAMSWAVGKGIIQGDDAGRVNPQDGASRAEVATILARFVAITA
ncbi:S-layer homology domain-containing protein [Pseudoflavonifractor phocaeensis]|uniref:S-layer homology domain-containing protein n=1 Tax=Pseudoflavonifractor phocaeensis TaxID=1870988 RepID=UPI00195AAE31|nr:S-layer homology domain-containing protein [Pseudoflavonifractor phocaeensis]MBM6924920.1 S-layer homology domain-containing protein [Pseudoflavonifractor phocaeensis]